MFNPSARGSLSRVNPQLSICFLPPGLCIQESSKHYFTKCCFRGPSLSSDDTRTSPHTPTLDSLTLSPCGYSEPSHTHNVSDIWRGSVLQQKEDNVQVAHEGGHMYWCEARLRNKATAVLLLCTGGFGASSDK